MFPCPACGWQLYASMYQACSHPEFRSSVGPRGNKKARLTHRPDRHKSVSRSPWAAACCPQLAHPIGAATDEVSVGSDFIRGNRKHIAQLENRLTCRPARYGCPLRVWSSLGSRPLFTARGVPGTGTPRAMGSACGLFASAHQIGLDEFVRSPSITLCTSEVWWPVRWSLTRLSWSV